MTCFGSSHGSVQPGGLLAVRVATAVSEDPGAPSAFLEPVLDVFTGGGIPVDVAEDLQMAGIQALRGELQLSADDAGVYLGGSRTVGCSIIVGDRFLGGTAGMGHTRVTAQGQPAWCDCGRSGCLTGVAGLTALLVRGGLLGQAAARRSVRDDPMAAADAVYAQAAIGNPRMIATLNVARSL